MAKNNIKSNNINNNQQTNNMQTPPAKPDDDSSNNDLSKPTMPNDFKPTDMNNSKEGIKLTTIYYAILELKHY